MDPKISILLYDTENKTIVEQPLAYLPAAHTTLSIGSAGMEDIGVKWLSYQFITG